MWTTIGGDQPRPHLTKKAPLPSPPLLSNPHLGAEKCAPPSPGDHWTRAGVRHKDRGKPRHHKNQDYERKAASLGIEQGRWPDNPTTHLNARNHERPKKSPGSHPRPHVPPAGHPPAWRRGPLGPPGRWRSQGNASDKEGREHTATPSRHKQKIYLGTPPPSPFMKIVPSSQNFAIKEKNTEEANKTGQERHIVTASPHNDPHTSR